MGWFKKGTVKEAVEGVGRAAIDIRTAITGKADPQTQLEYEYKFQELEQHLAVLQSETNKVEAEHPSIFVSGWRPFTGWVCGVAFATPLLLFLVHTVVALIWPESPKVAAMATVLGVVKDFALVLYVPVLLGMLGLSVNRTWEKYAQIDTKKIGNKDGGQ